jgi:hypothetical protein
MGLFFVTRECQTSKNGPVFESKSLTLISGGGGNLLTVGVIPKLYRWSSYKKILALIFILIGIYFKVKINYNEEILNIS